jgi:aromatic ring hydroxylase
VRLNKARFSGRVDSPHGYYQVDGNHQTGAINSHRILVMPTVFPQSDEKGFAVTFSIPVDPGGIVYITHPTFREELSKHAVEVGFLQN